MCLAVGRGDQEEDKWRKWKSIVSLVQPEALVEPSWFSQTSRMVSFRFSFFDKTYFIWYWKFVLQMMGTKAISGLWIFSTLKKPVRFYIFIFNRDTLTWVHCECSVCWRHHSRSLRGSRKPLLLSFIMAGLVAYCYSFQGVLSSLPSSIFMFGITSKLNEKIMARKPFSFISLDLAFVSQMSNLLNLHSPLNYLILKDVCPWHI